MWRSACSQVTIGALVFALRNSCPMKSWRYVHRESAIQNSDVRLENLKSPRDLEHLPLIWRERGAGTRTRVEHVLKEHGVNVRKLDQRVEIGSTEAIKSLVVAEVGVAFFSCWEIQNELATGTLREIRIPGLKFIGSFPGRFRAET